MGLIGYLSALLIGISLGALGMGGSILTVPIMIYIMHIKPFDATGYSLFVVGITSAIGCANYIRDKMVDIRRAVVFAIPSIASVFLFRIYIMPRIPVVIFQISGFTMTRDLLIILVFAVLMMLIAYNMIHNSKKLEPHVEQQKADYILLFFIGLISGMLTGFIGVGGGFIILPALVLLARIPVRMAIGTSLLIIAVNSLIGFAGEMIVRKEKIDFTFLLVFASFAACGVLLGYRLASHAAASNLKKIFGWLVLIAGVVIFISELFF
jgi:uncharacterized membrane protein YfcA